MRLWRFREPRGPARTGNSFATREQAIESAIAAARAGKGGHPDPGQIAGLWRGMAARGWRVEAFDPATGRSLEEAD